MRRSKPTAGLQRPRATLRAEGAETPVQPVVASRAVRGRPKISQEHKQEPANEETAHKPGEH